MKQKQCLKCNSKILMGSNYSDLIKGYYFNCADCGNVMIYKKNEETLLPTPEIDSKITYILMDDAKKAFNYPVVRTAITTEEADQILVDAYLNQHINTTEIEEDPFFDCDCDECDCEICDCDLEDDYEDNEDAEEQVTFEDYMNVTNKNHINKEERNDYLLILNNNQIIFKDMTKKTMLDKINEFKSENIKLYKIEEIQMSKQVEVKYEF